MTSGIQITGDAGVFQIDELYRNLVLRQKVSFGTSGDHAVVHNDGVTPVLAWRSTANPGMFLKATAVSGDDYTWTVNGIGDCYVFDVVPTPGANGIGLQVFDAAGLCAYDTSFDPFRPVYLGRWSPFYDTALETWPVNGERVDLGGAALTQTSGRLWAYGVFLPGVWSKLTANNYGARGVYTSGDNFLVQKVVLGSPTTAGNSSGGIEALFIDVTDL